MKPVTGTFTAGAAEDEPVAEGFEELPDLDPEDLDPAVPDGEAPELVAAARNRSVDWKVLQLDEEGVTGVYGGGDNNVWGILHVRVCPLDV